MRVGRVLVSSVLLAAAVGVGVTAMPDASSAAVCTSAADLPVEQLPTVTAKVADSSIPVKRTTSGKWNIDLSDVAPGGLYLLQAFSTKSENDGGISRCRYDTTLIVQRRYPDATWYYLLGINPGTLNQLSYAAVFDISYVSMPIIAADTPVDITMTLPDSGPFVAANYYGTDAYGKLVDECLQFFGGYGYMNEYPIARMYADARVGRIYGGANEVMKEIIARAIERD